MSLQVDLEQCLTDRRGWSLRHPRGENVVLMLTGGLDSSLLAEICIKELHATVYPFYIKRGAKAEKFEEAAAQNVTRYLQKKHGARMKDLYTVDVEIPPQSLKEQFKEEYVLRVGHPMRNALIELYAVQYASMLSQNGSSVHTIMTGGIDEDTRPDNGPNSFLTITLAVCVGLGDWDWQVVAPFLLENLLDGKSKVRKEDIIEWGTKNQFPFAITRSCTSSKSTPCGQCTACVRRNKLFPEEVVQ